MALHEVFTAKRGAVLIALISLLLVLTEASSADNQVGSHPDEHNQIINDHCQCASYNCGCCAHILIEKINLNNTVCVNLSYLPEDVGLSFTVTIGNRTIFNETVSARSPPPVCVGVPYLKELAEICIRFYDLDVTLHKVHGCIKFEARLAHVEVGDYDLGCFDIKPKGRFFPFKHDKDRIHVTML